MKTWLVNVWDSFRTGFWFFPTLLILAAMALAVVVPELDRQFAESVPDWMKSTGSSARSTLTTLASAMFTVAGVVFSVTVVTLSLTSSQFGPRLLRNFLQQSFTQVTFGACLACSIYCLILLWRVNNVDGTWFVPHVAVFLATVLTVIVICLVVYFIHRVAYSVQSMNVVTDVAVDLDATIDRVFPEGADENGIAKQKYDSMRERFEREKSVAVTARHDGYLQAINTEVLEHVAQQNDLVVEILCHPGDFLITGHEVARYLVSGGCKEGTSDQLAVAFIVGNQRTPRQDVECAISELAEVAVRALSPGINDPYTAVASIHRLSAAYCRLSSRDRYSEIRVHLQADEEPRILPPQADFAAMLDEGFGQIRRYGSSSLVVSEQLLDALAKIAKTTTDNTVRQTLQRQAELIVEGGEKQDFCGEDLARIESGYNRVAAACRQA